MSLRGCTIMRADSEVRRKFTFRIWNSETSEAHYFSATEEDEYKSWLTEVTKGAVKQISTSRTDINDSSATVYYYPKDHQPAPQIPAEPSPKLQKSHTLPEEPKPFLDLPGRRSYNIKLTSLNSPLFVICYRCYPSWALKETL